MATLDFSAARRAHMAWKAKLRAFLDGRAALSTDEAVSHRDCALGKWLYSEGMQQFGHLHEMQAMEKEHVDMHATVRRIIELANSGDRHAAEQEMPKIAHLSSDIVGYLNEIELKSSEKKGLLGRLTDLSIRAKIISYGTLVTLLLVVIGVLGYNGVSLMASKTDVIQDAALRVSAAKEMKVAVARDMQMIMELLASNNREELDAVWQEHLGFAKDFNLYGGAILKGGDTPAGKVTAATDEQLRKIVKEADEYHKSQFSTGIRSIYEQLGKGFAAVAQAKAGGAQDLGQGLAAVERVNPEIAGEVHRLDHAGDQVGEKMLSTLAGVEKVANANMAQAGAASHDAAGTLQVQLLVAIIVGLLLSSGFGLAILRAIMRPLATALHFVHELAEGDLTNDVKVSGHDEMNKLLAGMRNLNESLRSVVGEVGQSASSIADASGEISAGNTDLSQRTEEQASSLEETASSMEELTSTVQRNADNARQASQLASAARDEAESSGEVVERTVNAMTEINQASKKIADIIGLVDEIAFQTNLLALNAAVEAARAGEQGRGFAVVAGEVRNLAQRSANAAKEIKELIQDSVGKVEEGSRLVDQSGETLGKIVKGVKQVSDIVAEIAAASVEQSSGIEQVNKAIMQMDEVTQQNAAMVEEIAASSSALSEQAKTLDELVAFFKLP